MRFFIFILITLLPGCTSPGHKEFSQGISGKIIWLEGNMMPGPGRELPPEEPVVREVYIFNALSLAEFPGGPFYDISVSPLEIVNSDVNGLFEVSLEPGIYSILTREQDGLYASTSNGQYINPVKVSPDSISNITFKVDYKAFY